MIKSREAKANVKMGDSDDTVSTTSSDNGDRISRSACTVEQPLDGGLNDLITSLHRRGLIGERTYEHEIERVDNSLYPDCSKPLGNQLGGSEGNPLDKIEQLSKSSASQHSDVATTVRPDRPILYKSESPDLTSCPPSVFHSRVETPMPGRPGLTNNLMSARPSLMEDPTAARPDLTMGSIYERPGLKRDPASERPDLAMDPTSEQSGLARNPASERPGLTRGPPVRPGLARGPESGRPGLSRESPSSDRPELELKRFASRRQLFQRTMTRRNLRAIGELDEDPSQSTIQNPDDFEGESENLDTVDLVIQSQHLRRNMNEHIGSIYSHDGMTSSDDSAFGSFADESSFESSFVGDSESCHSTKSFASYTSIRPKPVLDSETTIGKMRSMLGNIITSTPFFIFNVFLIFVNGALLGSMTFFYDDKETTHKLEIADLAMLIFFTVENGSQLTYYGREYFKDGWLVFDGFIISVCWIFNNSSMGVLRSLRIFRLFTVASKFKSFQTLAAAIMKAIPKMQTLLAMMSLLFYVYCVLCTNLYHDVYDEGELSYDFFGRLDKSFLSLFQLMCFTSWTEVVRPLGDARPFSVFTMYPWLLIAGILFKNLVVAIICGEVVSIHNSQDATDELIKHHTDIRKNQAITFVNEAQEINALQREIIANHIQMQKSIMMIASQVTLTAEAKEKLEAMKKASAHYIKQGRRSSFIGSSIG